LLTTLSVVAVLSLLQRLVRALWVCHGTEWVLCVMCLFPIRARSLGWSCHVGLLPCWLEQSRVLWLMSVFAIMSDFSRGGLTW